MGMSEEKGSSSPQQSKNREQCFGANLIDGVANLFGDKPNPDGSSYISNCFGKSEEVEYEEPGQIFFTDEDPNFDIADHPSVKLNCGTIAGSYIEEKVEGIEGEYYGGIPYCTKPLGKFRFKNPGSPRKWGKQTPEKYLDCRYERERGYAAPIQQTTDDCVSEDCLFLNVWAPPLPRTKTLANGKIETEPLRPVIFNIYGGGYTGGCAHDDYYDGSCYADRGIVFVGPNYRLGALGFLYPKGAECNCAMIDLVNALKWVHEEIHKFGGDKNQATLWGESAGADSAYFLMCSPMAEGLWNQAFLMSLSSFTQSESQARELANEFVFHAIPDENERSTAEKALTSLQELDWKDILAVQNGERAEFIMNPTTAPGWRLGGEPVPDHLPPDTISPAGNLVMPKWHRSKGIPLPTVIHRDNDDEEHGYLFMPAPPMDRLMDGAVEGKNIIIGHCKLENGYDCGGEAFGPKIEGGRDECVQRIVWELVATPSMTPVSKLIEIAEELLFIYEDELDAAESAAVAGDEQVEMEAWTYQDLWDILSSDFSFITATEMVVRRLCHWNNKVYRYEWTGYDGKKGYHGSELPLIIGIDNGEKPGKESVRKEWMDCVAHFVHTGKPILKSVEWEDHSKASTNPSFLKKMFGVANPAKRHHGAHCMMIDGHRGFEVGALNRKSLQATADLFDVLWQLEGWEDVTEEDCPFKWINDLRREVPEFKHDKSRFEVGFSKSHDSDDLIHDEETDKRVLERKKTREMRRAKSGITPSATIEASNTSD